jgi:hypothetical protein
VSRYGSPLVQHETLAVRVTRQHRATREDLIREYDRLMRQLVIAGAEPVVTDAVLDCFTDIELGALIKDSALQLIRLRRLQA